MDFYEEAQLSNGTVIPTGSTDTIWATRADTGSTIYLMPDAGELARLNAGQPIALHFFGNVVPRLHPFVTEAEVDDAGRGIPAETGWKLVNLTSGPGEGNQGIASNDRALVYNTGDPSSDDSFELYVHIPTDPDDELQHAITHLIENTPGIDYTEIWPQMEADRAEIEAFQASMQAALVNGTTPPDVADLTVAANLAACHRGLLAFSRPLPPTPA